jgi:HEAT repeat protein
LQGDDQFAHSQAAFALGMLGDPAVEPLIDLLRHDDAEIRMRAAWALGVMGPPALSALLKLAEGDDTRMRVEAIRVLGTIGEARSLNQLLIGLTDEDPHIAARSARAIGKISDPRAYHALVTTLQHPTPDVRYEACRALADLGISDAAVILQEMAETDTGKTTWGSAVADAARMASNEVLNNSRGSLEEEFARVSRLIQQQLREKQHGE